VLHAWLLSNQAIKQVKFTCKQASYNSGQFEQVCKQAADVFTERQAKK
jgi:hypothetical protein